MDGQQGSLLERRLSSELIYDMMVRVQNPARTADQLGRMQIV